MDIVLFNLQTYFPDTEQVKEVIDRSDDYCNRVYVAFKNGYGLSIVQGNYTYGGQEGLFEIAPMRTGATNEKWLTNVFDPGDTGDEVLGYCTVERVQYYLHKVANLVGNEHED